MTAQIFKGGMLTLPTLKTQQGAFAYQSYLLDASGEKFAVIFKPEPESIGKTLTKVWFRLGAVTTGDTLKISLQGVSTTTGEPDGTVKGGGTPVSATLAVADTDDNIGVDLTFDNGYTLVAEYLAIVIEFNSYVAGSLNIVSCDFITDNNYIPYTLLQTGGTWAKFTRTPVISLGCSDSTYFVPTGSVPATALGIVTFNSGSSPNAVALRFKTLFDTVLTGCWVSMDLDGDAAVYLSSDGSTGTKIADIYAGIRAGTTRNTHYIEFDTSSTISKDTYYRLIFLPSTTTNIGIEYFDVESVAIGDDIGGGQDFHWSTATSPTVEGDWTNTTTRRMFCGLYFTQFSDGVGGGGVAVPQGIHTIENGINA